MWTSSRIAALFCLTTAVDCSSYPQIPCEPGDEATLTSCDTSGLSGLPARLRWHWKSTNELKLENVRQPYRVQLVFDDGSPLDLPTLSPPSGSDRKGAVTLSANLSSNLHLGGAQLVLTSADPKAAPIRIPVRLYATPSWVPDNNPAVLGTMNLDFGAPRSLAIDSQRRALTLSETVAATSSYVRGFAHDDSPSQFLAPSQLDALLAVVAPTPLGLSVNSAQNYIHFMIVGDSSTGPNLQSRRCQLESPTLAHCEQTKIIDIPVLFNKKNYHDVMLGSDASLDLLVAPHSVDSRVPKLFAIAVPKMTGGNATPLPVPDSVVAASGSAIRLAAGTLLPDQPGMFVVLQNTVGSQPAIAPQVLRRSGNALVAAESVATALGLALSGVGNVSALAIADLNGDKMGDLLFAKPGMPDLYYIENMTVVSSIPEFAKPVLLASASAPSNPALGFKNIDRIATGLLRDPIIDSTPGCADCVDIAIIAEQMDGRVTKSPGGLLAAIINRPM